MTTLSYKLSNSFNSEKLFFTSDTHFSHKNVLEYCKRPFTTVQDHDWTLVKNWNEKVPKDGIVFHLGDFGFGSIGYMTRIVSSLNGTIYFIRGNHDRKFKGSLLQYVKCDLPYAEISIPIKGEKNGKRMIVLCHYAFDVWNKSHYGSWHLHGHSHGALKTKRRNRMDVGVDANKYSPISYREIERIFEKEQ